MPLSCAASETRSAAKAKAQRAAAADRAALRDALSSRAEMEHELDARIADVARLYKGLGLAVPLPLP